MVNIFKFEAGSLESMVSQGDTLIKVFLTELLKLLAGDGNFEIFFIIPILDGYFFLINLIGSQALFDLFAFFAQLSQMLRFLNEVLMDLCHFFIVYAVFFLENVQAVVHKVRVEVLATEVGVARQPQAIFLIFCALED